jgi:hypothetical protein
LVWAKSRRATNRRMMKVKASMEAAITIENRA